MLCAAVSMLMPAAMLPQAREPLRSAPDPLRTSFANPPAEARPWVYWYFMDGHLSRAGMTADLEAMKAAGIGGAIFLEVGIGVPQGPVRFMSPEWQSFVRDAFVEADRLGIEIAMGSGPGWCGTGGPWVRPEDSMQHLVASRTSVAGPARFDAVLPRPQPRTPFFGEGTLTPELRSLWKEFYQDEVVLAFPTSANPNRIEDVDEKALYYRAPYSSTPGVKPFLTPQQHASEAAAGAIPSSSIVDLTGKLDKQGRLVWQVPSGEWTILRFGRTLTGQTTRPAPEPGIGFETDKFNAAALNSHLQTFLGPLLKGLPRTSQRASGVTGLHFDSWEMGAQNWSPGFRREFKARRGYDPLRMLPTMTGLVMDSQSRSERFLWDLRQTAQELTIERHLKPLKAFGKERGMVFSTEPYDMNPASDLETGGIADIPMSEFWSNGYGFDTEYSVIQASSIAHTLGRRIVAAEAFTSNPGEDWRQSPGSMKAQTDWALCAGINRFAFHRFQAQPENGGAPGMGMGPYGVRWDRTQTWWDMVPAYHRYLSRCQELLRQGRFVADVLYLSPEGAPNVFIPPPSAFEGEARDRRGYNFDGCAPSILISRASVRDGQIVMPDGMSYRVLVLPRFDSMTPALLRKVESLVLAGITVIGRPPRYSPSLSDYPRADAEVQKIAARLWGSGREARRQVGRGTVILDAEPNRSKSPLEQAKWIWTSEEEPLRSAPVGKRIFTRQVAIAPDRRIRSATVAITADNVYELQINGRRVGGGRDFHRVGTFDVAELLNDGLNEVSVTVENEGDSPNPAGLIAALSLEFEDGTSQVILTDSNWSASSPVGETRATELGPMGIAPWSLSVPPVIYPSHDLVSAELLRKGVPPDFRTDGDARYIHRVLGDKDLYFVASRSDTPQNLTAHFRVAGRQPEWWDPITGQTRPLSRFQEKAGVTSVPLRLEPMESGFVVFRRPAEARRTSGDNFPEIRAIQEIASAWEVAFDPKWGGPASVGFDRLSDWSLSSDPRIRYYSGKAVYRTEFEVADPTRGTYLSLGEVRNLASVRLNGHELGVVWCAPWRVEIPAGILKDSGNRLEITVANLWINRMVGDAALPPDQQFTRSTYRPFRPNSPLQPSGLLGPVTLQR